MITATILRPAIGLLLGLLGPVAAQAQLRIGPRIGFNLSHQRTPNFDHPGSRYRQQPLPGCQFGVAAELRKGSWALQPSLLFTTKGQRATVRYSVTGQPDGPQGVNRFTECNYYLEVPVQLAYQPAWARGLQVSAGPYAAVGLSGHYSDQIQQFDIDGNYQRTISREGPVEYAGIIFPTSGPSTFDLGLNAGLGYAWGPWLAQLQYSWGLRDVYAYHHEHIYHRTGSVSLSYLLPTKAKPQ